MTTLMITGKSSPHGHPLGLFPCHWMWGGWGGFGCSFLLTSSWGPFALWPFTVVASSACPTPCALLLLTKGGGLLARLLGLSNPQSFGQSVHLLQGRPVLGRFLVVHTCRRGGLLYCTSPTSFAWLTLP